MRACNGYKVPVPHSAVGRRHRPRWTTLLPGLLLFVAFTSVAQDDKTVKTGNPSVMTQQSSQQLPEPSEQSKTGQAMPIAQDERKKQIADESTRLLSMAIALKAEVDKTSKDTLSLNVIRKADEIEKLAHTVKEKIKQGAGPG